MAIDLYELLVTEEVASVVITVQEAQSLLDKLENNGWAIAQPNKQVVVARKGGNTIRFFPRPKTGDYRVSGPKAVLAQHGLKV